jgi:hypothetical protein
MSGRRLRHTAALCALAALVLAPPALAGSADVFRGTPAEPGLGGIRPAQMRAEMAPRAVRAGGGFGHAGVVQVHYWHPYGFYSPWGPSWYPGSWWYGWPAYGSGYTLPPAVPKDQVMLTFHVSPGKAEVTVDGKAVGKARDFDSVRRPLWLKPGEHVVEIVKPGYQTLRLAFDLAGGSGYDINYGLNKGTGVDDRSSAAAGAGASNRS